jgi:hypothetical protein
MKKMLFVLTALCLFSPAFAQASGTGQSSGGPARVGIPGQITTQGRGYRVMRHHRRGHRAMVRHRRYIR